MASSAVSTIIQLLCSFSRDPSACASITVPMAPQAAQQASPLAQQLLNPPSAGITTFPIVICSDQDSFSIMPGVPNTWYSTMLMGRLTLNEYTGLAQVQWVTAYNYTGGLAYKGRGMEFSDLKIYGDSLLTVDDKTGFVYKLQGRTAVPWVYLPDGDGTASTPYKTEWIAIRNDTLYIGGYGKEMTNDVGAFVNDLPLYIKTVDSRGLVTSLWWGDKFRKLRAAIEIEFPGYMIHESCQWSDIHQRWFFLPRHVSKLAYNQQTVDCAGTNLLLSANDDFESIRVTRIGQAVPEHGFSAFQFVPGTNDTIVVALKSVEEQGDPKESYIMVFNINGVIILNETRIPGRFKFEGIEFYDWTSIMQ